MACEYKFPRELRLLTPEDFKSVFSEPSKAFSKQILLLAKANKLSHPRLGLTIAKRHVKKANQRNRIKRVIRNSFRLNQHDLPAIDVVIIAKSGLGELKNEEIQQLIERLWKKITLHYKPC